MPDLASSLDSTIYVQPTQESYYVVKCRDTNACQHRWADTQSQSQGSPLKKRKRESSGSGQADSPFALHGIKTPETPYGAFMGKAPSPKTRKFWKLQHEELKRFEMTDAQKKEFEVSYILRWIVAPLSNS